MPVPAHQQHLKPLQQSPSFVCGFSSRSFAGIVSMESSPPAAALSVDSVTNNLKNQSFASNDRTDVNDDEEGDLLGIITGLGLHLKPTPTFRSPLVPGQCPQARHSHTKPSICSAYSSELVSKTAEHFGLFYTGLYWGHSTVASMNDKGGMIKVAVKMFDELPSRSYTMQDDSLWNSPIHKYFWFGYLKEKAVKRRPYSVILLDEVEKDKTNEARRATAAARSQATIIAQFPNFIILGDKNVQKGKVLSRIGSKAKVR